MTLAHPAPSLYFSFHVYEMEMIDGWDVYEFTLQMWLWFPSSLGWKFHSSFHSLLISVQCQLPGLSEALPSPGAPALCLHSSLPCPSLWEALDLTGPIHSPVPSLCQ